MSDIHMENMAAGIKSVFESSKYSDLTIRCKGNEFKVHRNILCPRSTFFTAACDGEFKEANSAQIALDDDDPDTVERMLSYFYTLDYEDENDLTVEELAIDKIATPSGTPFVTEQPEVSSEAQPLLTHNILDVDNVDMSESHRLKARHLSMLNNISVYAIADKYDIPTLKKLAEIKFRNLAYSLWPHHDFPAVVKSAYESTPDNDEGLRGVVASICADHVEDMLVLGDPSAFEMGNIGQLGFDILNIVNENSKKSHEQISSALAIAELQLRDKTADAEALKYDKYCLTEKLESWSASMEDIISKVRKVQWCRHCVAQDTGNGNLYFERVNHAIELRGILRCAVCRTKHSLN